jgi:hypothetical protein
MKKKRKHPNQQQIDAGKALWDGVGPRTRTRKMRELANTRWENSTRAERNAQRDLMNAGQANMSKATRVQRAKTAAAVRWGKAE